MSSFRQQRSSSPRFMPFPGLAGQRGSSLLQQNQSGYARSPSGSETDSVSTSTENLSHEERYAIRHTPRQEPQGQENISSGVSGSHCIQSGGPSSPILSSSCHRVPNIRDFEESFHLNKSGQSSYHAAKSSSHSSTICGGDSSQEKKGSGGREITEIPVDYLDQSQVLKHLAKEVTKIKCGRKSLDLAMSSPSSSSSSLSSSSPISLYPTSQKGEGQGEGQFGSTCGGGTSGSTAWPKTRRGSSSEASAPFRGRRLHLSQSQPDLSQLGNAALRARDAAALKGSATNPRPRAKARDMLEWRLGLVSSTSGSGRQAGAGMIEQVFWPQLEMVEILVQENSALKLELEACFQKVAKSQKLEQEVSKVHRSHQELIESCERRERLEKAARIRLQQDIRRLQELNHNLSAQLSLLVASGGNNQVVGNDTSSSSSSLEMSSLRKELAERELLLAQLVTSNKELAACKERQEIELAAQRATLQEQRTHIDILDTALTNAQGNVVRLEEECRKKQMYVERVGQLQRALSSLQLASDRREQTERKLRTQLEREIRELRERDMNNESSKSDSKGGGDMEKKGEGNINLEEEVRELRRQLREREERILAVEGELAQLERRCIQEGALRQAAIDAASIPKDAKIAALERTSQESERLVAEARSEKMRHMDEVHAAQRKVADLEARVKDLESRLAERDAMIRVLQKHTYEKDSAVAFLSSPHHTPHTSGLHSSSFHSGGGLHSSTLHGNALHANPLHSNSLHGNSYHGSSLHTGSLHGSSYHDSSVYRVAAAEILATTREELGSVSTASVFSTVNSSSGIGGSCDSSSGGNVSNLGGICSPGVGSGVGIGATSALRSVPFSSPSLTNATASAVVGGDAFVTGSSTVVSASREGASSTTTSNCSFDDAKKSLDDQLKELDSQLLSKIL